MNILYITEVLPYFPCNDGFRLVAYNMLKRLSTDNTIHLVSFYRTNTDLEHKATIEKFCGSIDTVLYKKPSFVKKILAFFNPYSWDNEMQDKISRALSNYKIDIIFAEGANIGQYVYKLKNLPKIIAPHDSSSARNYQFFKNAKIGPGKLLYLIRWIKSCIYEKMIYSKFDHCIVVGPDDANNLKKFLPNLKISVVTNGVDAEYYKYNLSGSNENNIIFTGNMSYLPNVDAALYFYNKIFPLISAEIKDVRLYLVGASPTQEILNLSKDKKVIITGAVDDLRTFIYKSAVYVCPLQLGTGIKNKILEAMAMGIPIVATRASIPGIDITDGKNIIVEDIPHNFARKVIDLMLNKEKRSMLAENGRKLVETQYSWEAKAKAVEKILKETKEKYYSRSNS